MPRNFNTNSVNNDEWLTPPYIVSALGHFDIDPGAPENRPWPTANRHFTKHADGLNQEWFGRVWLNPPYGRETFKWLEKLAAHKSGIALIFARTETKGFHKEVWNKANSIFFFEGRIKFFRVDGTEGYSANAPSCLISYSALDSAYISQSRLKGRHIYLTLSPEEEAKIKK